MEKVLLISLLLIGVILGSIIKGYYICVVTLQL